MEIYVEHKFASVEKRSQVNNQKYTDKLFC